MSPKKKTGAPKRRKLLLLDGHSLAYRAFFALPDTLATSSGQVTNAVYGFTAMLIKLLGDERPDGIAVCFDKGRPAYRHDRYAEYKANRSETPDLFREQLPLIRQVLDTLKVPQIEREGYEADDLLATLVEEAAEEGVEVVVVTGDRDCIQLIRDGVTMMMTRRGISDIARYDSKAILEKYGIGPETWTDFAALKGEPSDNLPGVPGIGDKTAAKLLQTYGDIEGVIEHADELTPRIRRGVTEMADQVRLNKELGQLLRDVELDVDPADIALEPWDDEEVRTLFTSLEFKSLYERLSELDLVVAADAPQLELAWFAALPDDADLSGVFVAIAHDDRWFAVSTADGEAQVLPLEAAPGRLGEMLADPDRPKVGHDLKPFFRAALDAGSTIEGIQCDTFVAAYVLEPGMAAAYRLADVARRYIGVSIDDGEPAPKRGKQASLDLDDDSGERAAKQAVAVRALAPVLTDRLRHRGMLELATDLEYPLIGVLARMEHLGILVDRSYLEELNSDLGDKMDRLVGKIHQAAGEDFNVNSTPQLQKILFEKLDLPKTRKIKTGYSTDQAELAKLAGTHPIVDALLEYREVAKLKTGFTDSLLPLIHPKDGRIHTTYMQASASTGRLASTSPNMQNIPIRGELGRQIRRAFIAPEGRVLVSADYSQIELRILAHLSEDDGVLEAFAAEHDFHAAIAAKVYGIDVGEVTASQRAFAKQFSYGIAYGMSAYGVSQRLGVEREEAEAFVDAYYEQFPKVKAFLDAQVDQARTDGYTTTMYGRRRYLPELQSSNWRMRAMGERMALNAPIQGSAADIMKRAMIDVDAAIADDPTIEMLLTVHDELVFEVDEPALDAAITTLKAPMEAAADLRCGLVVEVRTGPNWSAAHD